MPKFMIAYHGGDKPQSPEEGQAQMQAWKQWVTDLGDKIVNPGTPLPQSRLVTSSSVEEDQNPNAMMGFAIIQAENMDEAIEIAKSDPFLKMNGTIRLSEMMQMP